MKILEAKCLFTRNSQNWWHQSIPLLSVVSLKIVQVFFFFFFSCRWHQRNKNIEITFWVGVARLTRVYTNSNKIRKTPDVLVGLVVLLLIKGCFQWSVYFHITLSESFCMTFYLHYCHVIDKWFFCRQIDLQEKKKWV